MVQDLPDDVWSQIAETWSDKRALREMSLTSRRMRRLVVPVSLRKLKFHITHARSGPLTMVGLINQIMRAQFLFNSPDVLRHTRVFTLLEYFGTVDYLTKYLARREGSDRSSSRSDAENFLAVLHDAIHCLIFRMPRLREIHLGNTVMTALCYAAISSRPLLNSLSVQPRRSPDITNINPALPPAFRLRHFAYYNTWTGNGHTTDPYLVNILDHFISGLENLSMSSAFLPMVVSHIPLHGTLSLRVLSVEFPDYSEPSSSPDVSAFFHVLRACPQLRDLDLTGEFPNVEPTHYLPPPDLPNLSTFSGTSSSLRLLSGGKNVVKIHIGFNHGEEKQSLTQLIMTPLPHLRELYMEIVAFAYKPYELLTFIQSLAVFRNLERLDVVYELDISWEDNVSIQDSHNTINDLLRQLPCLHFLDISSVDDDVDGYDIGCPISKQGEPADRGHPSLESICVDFLCGNLKWSWDPRTGWERRSWAM